MTIVRCEGWWEQPEFGRQTMTDLTIRFDGASLLGSGVDLLGPFTLRGSIQDDRVAILKSYVGQHDVEYLGQYDGEGVLRGHWRIFPIENGGEWLIRVIDVHSGESEREIHEWNPADDGGP